MLRNSFRWSTNRLNRGFDEVHNSVDLCFLNHVIVRYITGDKDVRVEPPAVPYATNIVAGKDLGKPPRFHVANFHEPRFEKENVGCVESNTIHTTLPFNGASIATRIALLIHINAEFWEKNTVSLDVLPSKMTYQRNKEEIHLL